MARFRPDSPGGQLLAALDIVGREAEEVEHVVVKAANEKRITTGVMYVPGVPDAHDEYVDADDLEEAVHKYMTSGDLSIRKQHTDEKIGEVVGMISWPFEQEVPLNPADGLRKGKKVTLPAGTVYTTVKWSESAWPLVKAGKIRGLSMGGACVRVKDL